MRRKVLLSRAIACCVLILFVTAASADAVDTYLRAEMANQRLPGIAVAVLRDGKPLSVRTLGLANIELNAPVTRDTVFKIGSVSKQFIATGVMLLVRDGKVRLDDPLSKYFEDAPAAWEGDSFLTIAVDGPGLSVQSSQGGPQSRLLPEDPSTFFITKNDSYVFSREGGQVTRLSIRGGSNEVVANKVRY